MAIKFDGNRVTPKEFAKLWIVKNMESLLEHADSIFEKFPENYGAMTEREKTAVKECARSAIDTMIRVYAVDKILDKRSK